MCSEHFWLFNYFGYALLILGFSLLLILIVLMALSVIIGPDLSAPRLPPVKRRRLL